MRRITLAAALFLAGCAAQPEKPATPTPVTPQPVPQVRGDLIGLTAAELIRKFGSPAIQVREGEGLKIQFRGRGCVLDAYLYPPPQGSAGLARVTHVDTRLKSGAPYDQAGCIALLSS